NACPGGDNHIAPVLARQQKFDHRRLKTDTVDAATHDVRRHIEQLLRAVIEKRDVALVVYRDYTLTDAVQQCFPMFGQAGDLGDLQSTGVPFDAPRQPRARRRSSTASAPDRPDCVPRRYRRRQTRPGLRRPGLAQGPSAGRCATGPTTLARFHPGRGSPPGRHQTAPRRGLPPAQALVRQMGRHNDRGRSALKPCSRRPRSSAGHARRGTPASTEPPTPPPLRPARRRPPATGTPKTGRPGCGSYERVTSSVQNDQYFLCVLISDVGHWWGPVLLSTTNR